MLKLSIISKDQNASHVKAITKAAKLHNLKTEVVNFKSINEIKQETISLGDVIYWRTSSLDIKSERTASYLEFNNKLVINKSLFENPYITHKLYQQAVVDKISQVHAIPTYRFRNQKQLEQAVEQNLLNYPFIAKPNFSAHGVGVKLIKNSREMRSFRNYKEYIFQNYISNHGDWRVLVMGGRVLGVMKRIARRGSILNNISRGASSKTETDPEILSQLVNIASSVSAAFNLNFCAVDIIRNDRTGKYYFLEINTAPEWLGGFQATTGINVAKELVGYCLEMSQRKSQKTTEIVKAYYVL